MSTPRLVLASTSRYRAELLSRLGLPFDRVDPGADETPQDGESPQKLALRLAEAKARAGASLAPDAVIIGSDQVASLGGSVLSKPGDRRRAQEQLTASSGSAVTFFTGVCVLASPDAEPDAHVDKTEVEFRHLTADEIQCYLDKEPALDCAGSFKSEGLGISLMSRIASEDPTALQGLPLIWVARALRRAGFKLP